MNKTTKILIAIAIIIILAVLVYIFCLGRPVNDEQNKEWKRYYRKDLGFSVEYNDNNIIEREKDGMTLIYIGENQAHQTEWYDAYLLYFDWFEYDQEISLKRFVENKKKESELYFSETSDFEEIELGGEEDELNLSRVSDIKEIKLGDFNGFYYISKGRFGPYKDIFLHLKKGVILKINVSISGDQDGFYKKEVDRILPSLRKTFVLEKEVLGPQEKEPIINDTYNFDYMAFDQGVINMEGRAIGNWYFKVLLWQSFWILILMY